MSNARRRQIGVGEKGQHPLPFRQGRRVPPSINPSKSGFNVSRLRNFSSETGSQPNIARATELIAAPVAVTDPPAEHDAELDVSAAPDHRPLCPCCGGRTFSGNAALSGL